MEREVFMPRDVYVRRLRKEEKVFKIFKGKNFICCSSDGEPLESYANLVEARWDLEEHGRVQHTFH